MINKLRSHLGKSKGFTLIELLIVIAIIAILVVIAIVAINPIERIRDANDDRANSNVRSTIAAVQACLTKELAKDSAVDLYDGVAPDCNTWAALVAGNYVSGPVPTSLTFADDGSTAICVYQLGGHPAGTPEYAAAESNGTQIREVSDTGGYPDNTTCPL